MINTQSLESIALPEPQHNIWIPAPANDAKGIDDKLIVPFMCLPTWNSLENIINQISKDQWCQWLIYKDYANSLETTDALS